MTPWTTECQACLSLTIYWSLPKFMFIASVMPSIHLILWYPLLLPSVFPRIRTFPVSHLFASDDQKTSASASASVLLENIQDWSPLRLTGLILLSKGLWGVPSTAVWTHKVFGFLSSLLVHLLQSYVTTGKTIALTMWTFVGRVMSLLFKTLSGFAISFLPRSNHLLISWLQSLCAMILEPNKRKSVTTSTFPPSICHVVMRPDAMIFVFFNIEF